MTKNIVIIITIFLGVLILCCCTSLVGLIGFKGIQRIMQITEWVQTGEGFNASNTPAIDWEPTNDQVIITESEDSACCISTPQVIATLPDEDEDTLSSLYNEMVPENDPISLAYRLEGKSDISPIIDDPYIPEGIGTKTSFWVTDSDSSENYQIWATLQAVTEHAYFWIEEGISFKSSDLETLAYTFENHIYPTTRAFFGEEWSPGVDQDPHVYILFAKKIGSLVAGYYSSADELPNVVHEYSNEHEIFILNSMYLGIGDNDTPGVLAHEFQHMIHWHVDKNEDSWLNEGFSELAVFLNGYYEDGFDQMYTRNPDIQLNDWPNDEYATTPHYGSGFLFTLYFLERFGTDITQNLARNPENGFSSIDTVLIENGIKNNSTGVLLTSEDLFSDWVIANYLNTPDLAEGQYGYKQYPEMPTTGPTEKINTCPLDWQERDVKQFGVDYILVHCNGNFTLEIQGLTQTSLLPVDPYEGEYAYWSNKGDESDITLTRLFDFQDVDGNITMSYWTWYDLEDEYDYLYLLVSEDGDRWDILRTPHSTDDDPSGNSYGWAYNGKSGDWINEKIDLTQYAGQKIFVRFEYVTDAAVNGEGFLLDEITISAINYYTGFEQDEGGWEADGFVRVSNTLPQTYSLSLVNLDTQPSIERISLDQENFLSMPLNLSIHSDLLIVISGTTRFTRIPAYYRFRIIDNSQ